MRLIGKEDNILTAMDLGRPDAKDVDRCQIVLFLGRRKFVGTSL